MLPSVKTLEMSICSSFPLDDFLLRQDVEWYHVIGIIITIILFTMALIFQTGAIDFIKGYPPNELTLEDRFNMMYLQAMVNSTVWQYAMYFVLFISEDTGTCAAMWISTLGFIFHHIHILVMVGNGLIQSLKIYNVPVLENVEGGIGVLGVYGIWKVASIIIGISMAISMVAGVYYDPMTLVAILSSDHEPWRDRCEDMSSGRRAVIDFAVNFFIILMCLSIISIKVILMIMELLELDAMLEGPEDWTINNTYSMVSASSFLACYFITQTAHKNLVCSRHTNWWERRSVAMGVEMLNCLYYTVMSAYIVFSNNELTEDLLILD